MSPPTLFFLKIAFTILCHHFHIILELTIFRKESTGILTRIMLNLDYTGES